MPEIVGKRVKGMLIEEAARVQASLLKDEYENKEFTVPGGGYANVSLKAIDPSSFVTIERAHAVIIRTTANITFRFNGAGKDPISLSAAEQVFTMNTLEISDIFFTAPAATQIKVTLV